MSEPLGLLAEIAARKRLEVEALQCVEAAVVAKAGHLGVARPIATHLRGGAIVAEIKRRSPSGGVLRETLEAAVLARDYERSGAAAISVLTDGPDFGGSLDDLGEVRSAVDLPVLRKDFTIAPVQIAEARVAGADWVLLIVALLDDDELDACLAMARRCGADAIVEVHDVEETQRAVSAGAECIGINNRDLRTLRTDLGTFSRLRALVPSGVVCVAESGVRDPTDVTRLVGEGADAVLMGETLLRAPSPGDACAVMVRAGRAAARA